MTSRAIAGASTTALKELAGTVVLKLVLPPELRATGVVVWASNVPLALYSMRVSARPLQALPMSPRVTDARVKVSVLNV